MQIHQAAYRRAVDMITGVMSMRMSRDAPPRRGLFIAGREVAEDRIHRGAVSADANDRHAPACSVVTCINMLPCASDAGGRPAGAVVLAAQLLRIWRASPARPRLIRDLTVPSGSSSRSAIS